MDHPTYTDLIREFSGTWFVQVDLRILRFLEGDTSAAVVMGRILNLYHMKQCNSKDMGLLEKYDYWIRCPVRNLRSYLSLGEYKLRGALTKLVESKLLKTEYRAGKIMWVKPRFTKLEWLQDNSRNEKTSPPSDEKTSPPRETRKPRHLYTKKRDKNLSKKGGAKLPSRTLSNSSSGKSTPSPESEALARLLREGIRKKGRLFGETGRSAAYLDRIGGNNFQKLIKEVGSLPIVKEVAEFFVEHCSLEESKEMGLPGIMSAAQFHKQFEWIRDVMEKRTKVVRKKVGKKRVYVDKAEGIFREEPIYETKRVLRKREKIMGDDGRMRWKEINDE